jgi:hypothetical protein
MANDLQAPPDGASMTALLRGIISDVGDLIRQEIRFARTEMKSDVRKVTRAGSVLALGAGTVAVGVVFAALMLVYLIHHLSGAPDSASIPLWGCHGIVAAVFLVVGAGLSFVGYNALQKLNPLPNQTAQSVKENVEWIMNSK